MIGDNELIILILVYVTYFYLSSYLVNKLIDRALFMSSIEKLTILKVTAYLMSIILVLVFNLIINSVLLYLFKMLNYETFYMSFAIMTLTTIFMCKGDY